MTTEKKILLPPMQYYQKPRIGPQGSSGSNSANISNSKNPLQVVFPSGGFGLGLPYSQSNQTPETANDADNIMVASEPENFDIDILERRYIIYTIIVLGITNLIVTSIMYNRASTMDSSNVVPNVHSTLITDDEAPYNQAPFQFELVSEERRSIETTYYNSIMVGTVFGMGAALLESPLCLSVYALIVTLNFLLGTTAMPYFLFILRYAFDLFMLYAALVLRSKLSMNFLNMRVHRP